MCQDAGAWSWANIQKAFKEVAEETLQKVGLRKLNVVEGMVQQVGKGTNELMDQQNVRQIKEIKEAIYGGAAGIALSSVIGGGIVAVKKAQDKKKEEKEKKQAQAKQDAAFTAVIQHLEKQQGGK